MNHFEVGGLGVTDLLIPFFKQLASGIAVSFNACYVLACLVQFLNISFYVVKRCLFIHSDAKPRADAYIIRLAHQLRVLSLSADRFSVTSGDRISYDSDVISRSAIFLIFILFGPLDYRKRCTRSSARWYTYLYLRRHSPGRVEPASPRHDDVSWVGSTPWSPFPESRHLLACSAHTLPFGYKTGTQGIRV